MPGCCAYGCTNRPEKGFIMKVFPRDPVRRKQWAVMVRREGWNPTNTSYLCEVHFEADMWEKTREDGKRSLKWNAIPTIFPHRKATLKRKPPKTRKLPSPKKKRPVKNSENISETCTVPEMDDCVSCDGQKVKCLEGKLEEFKRKYDSLLLQNRRLKNKCDKYHKIIEKQRKINSNRQMKVFRDNQLNTLAGKKVSWSNHTIQKALKLRFACGNNGYEELLKQNYPLPSLRTLRRRIQNLPFKSGILYDVFKFLKLKTDLFKSTQESQCILLLDEMSIIPGSEFDIATKEFIGDITLPEHEGQGQATHALVFMLGGISSKWKQTVGYYLTGDSTNGAVYGNIISEIIREAHDIGLNVLGIVSDMGSPNQGFWRSVGIKDGRFCETVNTFVHPDGKGSKIFIIPDPVHLFKNIKAMLTNNKVITIPESVAKEFGLVSNYIKFSHIEDIAKHQKTFNFKLAPKLSEEDLTPTHLNKMKVSTSTNVINNTVSSSLNFLAEEVNRPDYCTTAWFIDLVQKWFALLTSRCPTMALSKHNISIYNENILFLERFVDIFSALKVGEKGIWKPVQTGVKLCTKSILDLQHILLNDFNFNFVLTSRFTQDSLENLFSLVRAKQMVPTALQFKQNLKLILISQYMKDISKGSYNEDDRETMAGFLEYIQNIEPSNETHELQLPQNLLPKKLVMNSSEQNSLYCLLGYIIKSIKQNNRHCDKCIMSLGALKPSGLSYEKLKCFKDNTLWFANEATFEFIFKAEEIFSNHFEIVRSQNVNLKQYFVSKIKNEVNVCHIPDCHDLINTLLNRYISFRLKIASKRRKSKNVFSSKSLAAHSSLI